MAATPQILRHSETGLEYLNCMTRHVYTTGVEEIDGLSSKRGLVTGSLVELSGGPRVGKTRIAFNVISTFVLPRPLGGHERYVVYLDMDGRFDAARLRETISTRILNIRGNNTETKQVQNIKIIESCLGRDLVIKCEFAKHVDVALQQTINMLSTSDKDFGLVVLSNLAGCFFDNRSRNACNSFGTMVARHVENLRNQHRVVVLTTISTLFETTDSGRHLLGPSWERLKRYKVPLKRML